LRSGSRFRLRIILVGIFLAAGVLLGAQPAAAFPAMYFGSVVDQNGMPVLKGTVRAYINKDLIGGSELCEGRFTNLLIGCCIPTRGSCPPDGAIVTFTVEVDGIEYYTACEPPVNFHEADLLEGVLLIKGEALPGEHVWLNLPETDPLLVPCGTEVQVAAQTKEIGDPRLQLWIKQPQDDAWIQSGAFDAQSGWTITRQEAGIYRLMAYARANQLISEVYSSKPYAISFICPHSVYNLQFDGPQGLWSIDQDAMFSAAAADEEGIPLFQFWIHDKNDWQLVQDFSPERELNWRFSDPGSYVIAVHALDTVDVRTGNWKAAYRRSMVLNVGSGVQLFAPVKVNPGDPVTVRAEASGITGVEYQLWYRLPNGEWLQSGDYNPEPTFTFVPVDPGSYQVIVYAKDHYAPATDQFAVSDQKTISCAP